MLCGVLIVIAAMESNSGITGVHVETSRKLQDEKLEFEFPRTIPALASIAPIAVSQIG